MDEEFGDVGNGDVEFASKVGELNAGVGSDELDQHLRPDVPQQFCKTIASPCELRSNIQVLSQAKPSR